MSYLDITINGVAMPKNEQDTVQIDTYLGQTISTASFTIYDKNNDIDIPEGLDVVITRHDTGERVFAGLVSGVDGTVGESGVSRIWNVRCQDYNTLLGKILFYKSYYLGFTYDGLTGDQAVIADLFENQIVGQYGATAPASEINARTYVKQGVAVNGAIDLRYRLAREALSQLASYAGFNFYVDYNKNLHYYFRETVSAPFGLSRAYDGIATLQYRGIKWSRDATQLLNNFVLLAPNLQSATQTYILPSNGVKTTLTLGIGDIGNNYPLDAIPGDRTVRVDYNSNTNVSPTWTPLTVGLATVDTIPPYQVLHDPLGKTLTFAVAPPNFANSVRVRGIYRFASGQPDSDGPSFTKYGRIFTGRITAADATGAQAMTQKLQNLKQQFAQALELITLKISDSAFPVSSTARFDRGQLVHLTDATLGVDKDYLIHRISTRYLGGTNLEYTIEGRDWFTDNLA